MVQLAISFYDAASYCRTGGATINLPTDCLATSHATFPVGAFYQEVGFDILQLTQEIKFCLTKTPRPPYLYWRRVITQLMDFHALF